MLFHRAKVFSLGLVSKMDLLSKKESRNNNLVALASRVTLGKLFNPSVPQF